MKKLYQIKNKVIIISIAILLIALCAVLCIFKVQATKTAKNNISLNAVAEGINLQSDIYHVEEGYISRILPETTLRDLKNNLDKEEITITKKDGNLLKETEFVGTGMTLKYGSKEYKLAVIDDLNGDGKAGITDLTQMKLISVGLRAKPVNEYAKAGDINNDGKVSITDLTKSNLASVNLIDIIAPARFTPEVVSTKDTITVEGETSDSNSGVKEYWFEINNNGWVQNTDKLNTKYTFEGLNMETKYTIRMKAVDKAGNVRVTKRIEIETLNEENANISIVASTEEWTNQNILVAINFNSNVAKEKKQISIDNGNTWVDYTAPITVEKNITIKARVVNTSGVVLEEQQKQITNIDKLAPKEFKASVTTTDNSITVNAINAIDADATSEYGKSEIKEYQYEIIQGNMKWAEISQNSTFTFTPLNKGDKYRIKVKAIDNAGNEKNAIKLILEDGTEVDPDTTEIIVRDNTVKYTLTYNANGGTVTPTSVEAKAGETITIPTPTKEFTVRYSVGNDVTVVPDSVTITYTFDGWYTSLEGEEVVNYTTMPSEDTEIFAHWTCANPSITLPTPGEKDGYEFDGWYTDEELTDKIPDGPYTPTEDITLYPKWKDIKLEVAGNPTEWTNEDVVLTITPIYKAGRTVTITVNGIEQTSEDSVYSYTVSENETYTIVLTDDLGNSVTKEVEVTKIDKTAPTITFSKESESNEATTQEVGVTVTEEQSGIEVCKYLWSTSATAPEEEEKYIHGEFTSNAETISQEYLAGEYYLHVYMKDNAGNTAISSTSGMFKFRYEIWNEEDFIHFMNDVELGTEISNQMNFYRKTVYIMDDIQIAPTTVLGEGRFDGTLEGNGHKISGINKNTTLKGGELDGVLFADLWRDGTIRDLGLENIEVTLESNNSNNETTGNFYGGFVGRNWGAIENCYITGTINFNNTYDLSVGGLVGVGYGNSSVKNSHFQGTIEGNSNAPDYRQCRVGGIIGGSISNIEGCYFSGELNIRGTHVNGNNCICVGGIAGVSKGKIENCYTEKDSTISSEGYVGGIAGEIYSTATVQKCYNLATVRGTSRAGGICGTMSNSVGLPMDNAGGTSNTTSKIENCYNKGIIISTENSAGGISGMMNGGATDQIVNYCYNTGSVTGASMVGGIVGDATDTSNGQINNSYNIGTVSTSRTDGIIGGVCGGLGHMYSSDSATTYNSHNEGSVGTGKYYGGIVGQLASDGTVRSCKYKRGTTDAGIGVIINDHGIEVENSRGDISGKAEVTTSMPTILSIINGSLEFKADTGINDGYPILKWQ